MSEQPTTRVVIVPDVEPPTAKLCWKQNAAMVRCNRAEHDASIAHTWEMADRIKELEAALAGQAHPLRIPSREPSACADRQPAGIGLECTLPKGHEGDHIGEGFKDEELGRWPNQRPTQIATCPDGHGPMRRVETPYPHFVCDHVTAYVAGRPVQWCPIERRTTDDGEVVR